MRADGADASVAVGDATIAYGRIGSGEPILVLNGYAATRADWDPGFLERLGAHGELLCPDHRGIGDSEGELGELSVELMAADAAALIRELELGPLPVIGWSMGGFVAQQLAAAEPELVSDLVLLSTDPGGAGAVGADPDDWQRLADHSGTPREQASRLTSLLFPPQLAPTIDAQFGELVAAARARLDPEVLSAQERAMAGWHAAPAEPRLESIRAPVLCAAGTEDRVIPAANTALLAAALGGSWRALFPGAGHAFMAQEPVRLADLIGLFLGR